MSRIDPHLGKPSPAAHDARGVDTRPPLPAREGRSLPLDVIERGRGGASIFDAPRPAITRPEGIFEAQPPVAPAAGTGAPFATLERLRAALPRALDGGAVLRPGLHAAEGRLDGIARALSEARTATIGRPPTNQAGRYGAGETRRALDGVERALSEARAHLDEFRAGGAEARMRAALAETHASASAVAEGVGNARTVLEQVGPWLNRADVAGAASHLIEATAGAQALTGELALLGGHTGVVSAVVARAAALEAAQVAPPSPAELAGTLGLTQEDLAQLGSTFAAGQVPPQMLWNASMVASVAAEGLRQGGLTAADSARHAETARSLLGVGGEGQGRLALDPADLVAVLKAAGLDLTRIDPGQVMAATRYLNTATTRAGQAEALARALDSFQTLSGIGLPKLPRGVLETQLASLGVKGHATRKLSEPSFQARFQEIARVANSGGEYRGKIGGYDVKLKVGADGTVLSSQCKKSFWSKLGGVFKNVVLPVALTVMSFIPVTAPIAIAANAALSAYRAVKAKSLLGIATAAVGMVGAGAGLVASRVVGAAATAATRVSNVATSVSRALQGVSSLKQGSLLGGLAAIGSGVAGGIGAFAKTAGEGLSRAAARLDEVSTKLALAGRGVATVDDYRSAGRAVSEAKATLRRAEASGDTTAIAAARQQLEQAERAKTSAVLGTVASAASLAADARASYSRQPGEAVNTPGARLTLDVALRTAWRGLSVAQGIHDRDFAAAGVSALGLAAVARQATGSEPSKGLGLTDAANMADAALGYHQASQREAAANAAVAQAERALKAAKLGGDADAIHQAEANLQQARKAREGALMGSIAAGETALGTAAAIGEKRQELGQVERIRRLSAQRGDQLLGVLQDPRMTLAQKQQAMAALLQLAQAGTAYEQAVSMGDASAMEMARREFEALDGMLRTRPPGSVQVASLGLRDVEPSASAFGSDSGTSAGSQATGAYRVSEGDSLWGLAKNYGITVEDLLAVNPGLGPEGRIRAGEVIRIPMPERSGTGTGTDAVVTIEIPPPRGLGAISPQAPASETGSGSVEGWHSFWAGVIEGDFSDNDSWSKTGGQVLAGFIPWVGQAADVRDTLAALDQVRQGRPGAWLGLLAAGIAWVPGAGDALKGVIRGGKKVAGEAAEATLTQGAKRIGKETAEEAAEAAARGTSLGEATSRIGPKGGAPARPSWQASETDFAKQLEEVGFEKQGSYLRGEKVPYGTPGSVRPDLSNARSGLSVDVKNYDLASPKGRYRLVQDILGQVEARSKNLPAGSRQGIIIDIRGQAVNATLLQRVIDRIVSRSNGAVNAENIFVAK